MKKIFLFVVAVSILATTAFAQTFSDLPDSHWAKNAVQEMVDQKIISGYTDGTFRPSKDITKIESLILLARIAGINDNSAAATKYLETYTSTLSKYTTQYKKDVAYLLGTKVLNTSDLDGLLLADRINSPLTREEMAVLVTKILGKETEVKNKSMVVLSFADTSSISSNAKAYVYFVYTEGYMTGVDANNFSPKTNITRAQAAAILQRIYKKVNITPDATTTDPTPSKVTSFVTGTITKVDTTNQAVWIKDSSGSTDEYEYDSKTEFYLNSKESTYSALAKDLKVTVTLTDDAYITVANITKAIEKSTVTGTLSTYSTSAKTITVLKSSKKYVYNYDTSTKFYLDNKTSTVAKCLTTSTKSKPITVTLEDDYITVAKLSSSKNATYGIITDFDIDSSYEGYIEITDADDDNYEYDFYSDCKFYLNGTQKKTSSIKTALSTAESKKYEVSLTLNSDNEITKVEISQYPTQGIISDYDFKGETIEIETPFGKTYEYDFDDSTLFYLDDSKISSSKWEIKVEDAYDAEYKVKLTLDSSYIEKIEIFTDDYEDTTKTTSSNSSSDTLDDYGYIYGTVTSITSSKITIDDDNSESYSFTLKNCIFIDQSSSTPEDDYETSYKAVSKGDEVVIFEYKSGYTSLVIILN